MYGMVWGFDAIVYIVKDMLELTLYMYGCNRPNYVLSYIFNISLKYQQIIFYVLLFLRLEDKNWQNPVCIYYVINNKLSRREMFYAFIVFGIGLLQF